MVNAMQRLFAPGLFKNKVNLVTGGGTGIGFGTAAGLAQLGSKVCVFKLTFLHNSPWHCLLYTQYIIIFKSDLLSVVEWKKQQFHNYLGCHCFTLEG